jgi:uncharacterized protein (TIGR02246 family)
VRFVRHSTLAAALLAAAPFAASAQVLPGGHHERSGAAGAYAATVRQRAENVSARWKEAWDRRDAAAVAALYAKNGVLMVGNGTVVRGRAAIADYLKSALPLAYPVTVEPGEFGMSGDLAYLAGLVTYQTRDAAGNSFAHAGPYRFVLRSEDSDVWEIRLMAIPGPARADAPSLQAGGSGSAGAGSVGGCAQAAASECPHEGQKRAPGSVTAAPHDSQRPAR